MSKFFEYYWHIPCMNISGIGGRKLYIPFINLITTGCDPKFTPSWTIPNADNADLAELIAE